MSYLEHYGLSSEPFSNAPVSRFYYDAPQHQQALKRLLYSVSSMKGLSVLVGEIGAGKTTLARRLLDSLPEEEYEAALLVIIHSGITASWLLRRIALQIGVENPAQEKLALLSQLYQRLLQIYEQGRKAVVLIDEAQMLETRELMEEFRGLLNLEVPERKLISFVFFGLPEIEKNLKLDAPLAQRVAMRYRLEPFTNESTSAYIKHRMRLAGAARNPFTEGAMECVHRRSGGTPRVINTLCDNALFETFLSHSMEITEELIENIATNLGLEYGAVQALPEKPSAPPPPAPTAPNDEPRDEMKITTPAAPAVVMPAPAVTPVMSAPVSRPQPPPIAKPQPPRPPAPALTKPVAPAVKRPPVPPAVRPKEETVSGRPAVSPMSSAMASLTGEGEGEALPAQNVQSPARPAAPAAPKTGVDLAEIDRYLEGLGKL
jgi:general secretion pathway protein A